MSFLTLIGTAFGLSMDAFAVSVTYGVTLKKAGVKSALTVGSWFGFFQALMPLLGWLAGIKLVSYISEFDHWVVLLLLSYIGIKMILEAVREENEDCNKNLSMKMDVLESKTLFLLAVATSIDALVVGISLACLNTVILRPAAIIGIITFLLCFLGVMVGKRLKCLIKKNAQLLGGIILVLIGFKVFAEHTDLSHLIRSLF